MAYKKIKIAVCLYGQTRTALYCAPWITQWFSVPAGTEMNIYNKSVDVKTEFVSREPCEYEVDFFLHIKDYNTYSNTIGDPDWSEGIRSNKISAVEIDKIIKAFNPKKYQISSFEEEQKLITGGFRNTYGAMYHSIGTAMRLKREHEIETGELYDYCFAHRYDGIVGPSIETFRSRITGPGFNPLSVLALGEMYRWKWENWRVGPNDVFMGGDNLAMEILLADASRVYITEETLMCNDDLGGPNVVLGRSFGTTNIKFDEDPNLHCAIVRHSADLSIPVFESWQYHQNFWLTNHKSNLL